jgi:chemotaxis protein CheC
MVGAIMATVLAVQADQSNLALVMDSRLIVEGQECELTFLLLPSLEGIGELLARLGLA